MASYLDRTCLAELLGVSPTRVAQWTKDGTIPPDWYHQMDDGKAFAYAPVTVALGLLIFELERFLGKASPLTKPAARRAAPVLRHWWDELSAGKVAQLETYASVRCAEDSAVELRVPLTFLATARARLAQVPA